MLKREFSDSNQDNSFTKSTAEKTNKSKLADLLGFHQNDTNFTSVMANEPRRTSSNRLSDNNLDDEEENRPYMQNRKGTGSRTNLSAMEAEKKGYSHGYEQQRSNLRGKIQF